MTNVIDQVGPPRSVATHRSRTRLGVTTIVCVCWLVVVVAAALLGNTLTRYGATVAVPDASLLAPSPEHILGTDNFSRDVLDRLIVGARSSVVIGLAVAVASGLLGGTLGILVAVWPRLDNPVMRVLDGLIAFPSIILAIMVVTLFGGGESQVIVALTVVFFPRIARVIRGITLSVVASPYVEAGGVMGGGRMWAAWHHVLPNLLGPLGVQATYAMSRVIVIDAGLSFLGLAVPPPAPTWGNMLGDARLYIDQAWWMMLAPGLCIVLTAVAVNFVGDWLRDIADKTTEVSR